MVQAPQRTSAQLYCAKVGAVWARAAWAAVILSSLVAFPGDGAIASWADQFAATNQITKRGLSMVVEGVDVPYPSEDINCLRSKANLIKLFIGKRGLNLNPDMIFGAGSESAGATNKWRIGGQCQFMLKRSLGRQHYSSFRAHIISRCLPIIPDFDCKSMPVVEISANDFDDIHIGAQLPFGSFIQMGELALAGIPEPIGSAPQGEGEQRDYNRGGGRHKIVSPVDPFEYYFGLSVDKTLSEAAAFFGTLLAFFLLWLLTRRKH